MSTTITSPSTPLPAAPTPPTGTWQHPRMNEIEQRREAGIFTRRKLIHALLCTAIVLSSFAAPGGWFLSLLSLLSVPPSTSTLCVNALRILLFFSGARSFQPFWAPVDEMTDIPLTPSQRKLLGLTPSSAPATPGATYITPPRYARSTPRSDNSRLATHGSSPAGPNSPYTGGSPLARKAMNGRRFSGSSLFDEGISGSPGSPVSSSPSAAGRGASVPLNSKFLYQRAGKSRLSGSVF